MIQEGIHACFYRRDNFELDLKVRIIFERRSWKEMLFDMKVTGGKHDLDGDAYVMNYGFGRIINITENTHTIKRLK